MATNSSSAMSAAQQQFGMGHAPAQSALDATSILGPSPGSLRTNPYDKLRMTHYDYPEAVKDQTLFVETTITGFILESIEWYTTVCLPWAETSQMSVTWNEWHFTRPLADRVPHEGISRLITSSKSEQKAFVVRRGLAFVMEADFANTDQGVEQFVLNVQSISQSVQETQNHDTIWALLSCKDYNKLWEQRFGQLQVTYTQIVDSDIEMFGSVCRPDGDKHLEVIIEKHKRMMGKQGVSPDMLILWPGARIYMAMTPPERIQYWKAGPDGTRRLEQGPLAMANYRGMPVFETRDFEVEADSPRVQLLTRPTQVSEYYQMRFDRTDGAVGNFTSQERGIVLYDANVNDWRKITFLEAFRHGAVFGANGEWSSKIHDLVDHYNARRHKGKDSDSESADGEVIADTSDDGAPTFFLTTKDNDGKYMPLRYFGQMEEKHATSMHMQRVGETIAAAFPSSVEGEMANITRLIDDIESQGYDYKFFLDLIAANTRSSVADNGAFVGEKVPADLLQHWGLTGSAASVRDWKPNAYGSLRLPQTEQNITFPPGYGNYPGLQTLAAEARDPNSHWHAVGQRAARAVNAIQDMVDHLRSALPTSAAVDVHGRSFWFHRADAATTAFEHLISIPRHPLFMLSLPPLASQGLGNVDSMQRGGGMAEAGSARSEGVPWFVLPGTVRTTSGNRNIGTAGSGDTLRFYSPTLGRDVDVSVAQFSKGVRFSPEIRALGSLPGGDSTQAQSVRDAYTGIMTRLRNQPDARRKLMAYVNLMGTEDAPRMWRTLVGLQTVDESSIVNNINTLYLSDDPTDAEVQAMTELSKRLSAGVPGSTAEWATLPKQDREWEPIAPHAASVPLSAAGVADDVQTILDLEAEITGLSTNVTATTFANPLAPVTAGLTAATGNGTRLAEAVAELTAAVGRVNATLARQGGDARAVAAGQASARAVVARSRGEGTGVVAVSDSVEDVASSRYYRIPLTSSLALVNSLSEEFAGRGSGKPLVLPSDPATGHTLQYTIPEGGASVFDPDVLGSSDYGPIGQAISSPAYATIAEVHRDPKLRAFDETPMVARHKISAAAATVKDVDMFKSKPIGAPATTFEDDPEFSDDEEDEAVKFFGAPQSIARGVKRSRFGGDKSLIGAHEMHDIGALVHVAHLRNYSRTRTPTLAKRWADANHISNPVVRAATHAFLITACGFEKTWTNMIENDILTPCDIYLWRINIVFEMASGIMMKGGLETGANLQGGGNASKSHDGISKRIYFNFTFRSKSVVWRHRNVIIIENIKFERYGGGLNTKFVKNVNDMGDPGADRPSIIATLIPPNERSAQRMMDFSGKLSLPQINPAYDNPDPVYYTSGEYYDKFVWHLSDDVTLADPRYEDFFDKINRRQLLAFQGIQYSHNKSSGAYSRLVVPQGHLKLGMCYPGAFPVFNGGDKTFTQYDFNSVRIEA